MVVTTQALLSLWPFLKRMIFGDRAVKEVLRENKYITFMLFCILMLLSTVVWVGNELDAVKAENRAIVQELEDLKATQGTPDLDARRRRLDDLLK
uniref:Uncharacterized protein n=1 Tax=Pseudomonas phage RVTF4 TaxID=3236931 RepID=A0AB39CD45_9VIRU